MAGQQHLITTSAPGKLWGGRFTGQPSCGGFFIQLLPITENSQVVLTH